MERRLKERLVGAGILVVLIVLVVPELLSGPKGNGAIKPTVSSGSAEMRGETTRTVTVDLNTNRAMTLDAPQEDVATASGQAPANPAPPPLQPAAAVVVPPPRPAAPEPVPVPGSAAPLQPAPVPAPAAAGAPSVPPPAIENPAPSPRSWTLQLGSFASRANADQLLRIVKAHNSPAYLSKSGTGTSVRYRVRVGPLADRVAAERMLAKLKSEGHPASVVAP